MAYAIVVINKADRRKFNDVWQVWNTQQGNSITIGPAMGGPSVDGYVTYSVHPSTFPESFLKMLEAEGISFTVQ